MKVFNCIPTFLFLLKHNNRPNQQDIGTLKSKLMAKDQ